jgi:hypothetical protein
MASKRGAENIKQFNAARSLSDLALVEQELKLCKKRKMQFQSPGLLAAYLADVTQIHRTTFGRNIKYKSLIAIYIGTQPGAASIVGDESDDPWILKTKLSATQAELGNLKAEMKRLNSELSRLHKPIPIATGNSNSDIDFSNVCVLLAQVMKRAEVFRINRKDSTLIDLSAKPSDQIVGNSHRVHAFMQWLSVNEELPYVKDIISN